MALEGGIGLLYLVDFFLKGDLKQFLLATAGKTANPTGNSGTIPPLTMRQTLALAYQIARGMDALYRARYIHK